MVIVGGGFRPLVLLVKTGKEPTAIGVVEGIIRNVG